MEQEGVLPVAISNEDAPVFSSFESRPKVGLRSRAARFISRLKLTGPNKNLKSEFINSTDSSHSMFEMLDMFKLKDEKKERKEKKADSSLWSKIKDRVSFWRLEAAEQDSEKNIFDDLFKLGSFTVNKNKGRADTLSTETDFSDLFDRPRGTQQASEEKIDLEQDSEPTGFMATIKKNTKSLVAKIFLPKTATTENADKRVNEYEAQEQEFKEESKDVQVRETEINQDGIDYYTETGATNKKRAGLLGAVAAVFAAEITKAKTGTLTRNITNLNKQNKPNPNVELDFGDAIHKPESERLIPRFEPISGNQIEPRTNRVELNFAAEHMPLPLGVPSDDNSGEMILFDRSDNTAVVDAGVAEVKKHNNTEHKSSSKVDKQATVIQAEKIEESSFTNVKQFKSTAAHVKVIDSRPGVVVPATTKKHEIIQQAAIKQTTSLLESSPRVPRSAKVKKGPEIKTTPKVATKEKPQYLQAKIEYAQKAPEIEQEPERNTQNSPSKKPLVTVAEPKKEIAENYLERRQEDYRRLIAEAANTINRATRSLKNSKQKLWLKRSAKTVGASGIAYTLARLVF